MVICEPLGVKLSVKLTGGSRENLMASICTGTLNAYCPLYKTAECFSIYQTHYIGTIVITKTPFFFEEKK
jgi:hypothetical protein